MTSPTPIPLSAVTCESDLFRCVPMSCVLSAGVCAERQHLNGGKVRIAAWGTPKPGASGGAFRRRFFGRCGDCELGRAVRARLEA